MQNKLELAQKKNFATKTIVGNFNVVSTQWNCCSGSIWCNENQWENSYLEYPRISSAISTMKIEWISWIMSSFSCQELYQTNVIWVNILVYNGFPQMFPPILIVRRIFALSTNIMICFKSHSFSLVLSVFLSLILFSAIYWFNDYSFASPQPYIWR